MRSIFLPLRISIGFVLLALLSLLMLPLVLIRPLHRNNMGFICTLLSRVLFFYWGCKLEIEHEERLSPTQPTIIICNHQDTHDMFFAESLIRNGTVAMGKWELLYIPFIGWLFFLAGNIMVKRGKKEKAQQAMSLAAKKMRKDNLSLLIFPEGTRNNGNPLPFKLGAFRLAIEAQVPIQPVAVSLRKHSMNYYKWHSGMVKMKCLTPISTEGLTQDDVVDLAVRCRKLIEAQCIEVTKTLPIIKQG